jgi:hypothetical protein
MHGAMETPHITHPPAEEVDWVVHPRNGLGVMHVLKARTWFRAREEGARLFGMEPGDLRVTRAHDPKGLNA